MRWPIALFLALLAGTAFASDEYRLQPDDVVTITVFGHDELSRDAVLLKDGTFNFPLVGRVVALNATPTALEETLAKGLAHEVREPQVTVSVKQQSPRKVYAGGLLARPGSFDLKPGWRISHLLVEAGGLASSQPGVPANANFLKAVLVRGTDAIAVDLPAVLGASAQEADLELQPGDLLQVQPDTNLVHVAGEVRTPGDYQLKSHLGVLEAVTMAGGPTPSASLTRAQIVRKGEVIKVDLYGLLVQGKTEGNFEMLPGDTLVVPANEARIAVLGGVQQPGYFDLPDGKALTLSDALGLARGAVKGAKLDKVSVVRSTAPADKPEVLEADLERFFTNGDAAQNPRLKTGDIVYVPNGKEPLQPRDRMSTLAILAAPFLSWFR